MNFVIFICHIVLLSISDCGLCLRSCLMFFPSYDSWVGCRCGIRLVLWSVLRRISILVDQKCGRCGKLGWDQVELNLTKLGFEKFSHFSRKDLLWIA